MSPSTAFIRALAFATTAVAITSDEANLIAWKAYGDAIGKFITAGQPLAPGQDFIYVAPPTSNFVRGGTPVPGSITNFETFNFVNPLQDVESPQLGTDGPSYTQTLENYLLSVNIQDKELTPEQEAKRLSYDKALKTAQTKFSKEKSEAFLNWRNDEVAKYFNQSFQSWVADNDPTYFNYEQDVLTADGNYDNYLLSIYGTKYNVIQEQRRNINNKAQVETSSIPGYNMAVYPDASNYAVSLTPFVKNEINDFVAFRPAYSLNQYEDIADNFFKGAAGSSRLEYNFKNVDGHDWSSLGYQKKVVKGRAGFFGIIGVKASKESEVEQYDSWSNNFSQEVKVTLTTQGAPQVVTISPGSWDVGNFRKVYPRLRKGETDDLVGHVRLVKALVAYGISLQIEFTDVNTWNNVTRFIQKGQTGGSGGVNIFGFSFGAGGSGAYNYKHEDLKT